jgi:hypothetical protein
VVAEWERSGLDRKAFAASRRIDARRLSWWRWRLRGGPLEAVSTADLRLVKVDVEPEARSEADKGHGAERVSWELVTPRGVLRVHEGIGEVALAAVLAALVEKGSS